MPGNHCCAVPKNFRDQFAVTAPFFEQGLRDNKQCVFVAHDNSVTVVKMALRSHGLPLERVAVVESQDTPLNGPLDAERLYAAWAAMTDAAVAAGFSGLCVVVEMTWALDRDPEALAAYEKGAEALFEAKPLDALCLYNWNVFQERVVIAAGAASHPAVLTAPS